MYCDLHNQMHADDEKWILLISGSSLATLSGCWRMGLDIKKSNKQTNMAENIQTEIYSGKPELCLWHQWAFCQSLLLMLMSTKIIEIQTANGGIKAMCSTGRTSLYYRKMKKTEVQLDYDDCG